MAYKRMRQNHNEQIQISVPTDRKVNLDKSICEFERAKRTIFRLECCIQKRQRFHRKYVESL